MTDKVWLYEKWEKGKGVTERWTEDARMTDTTPTHFEDRLRDLAIKAANEVWTYDPFRNEIRTNGNIWWTPTNDEKADEQGPFIAYVDPATATLVASALKVMRQRVIDGNADLAEVEALAALDKHYQENK
jgi:hypothetical protein